MASGTTRVSDLVIVPGWLPYLQQYTTVKSAFIQSGVAVRDPALDAFLAGSGLTVSVPSTKDLDNDADNVSSTDPTASSTPNKIGTATEIAVRLNRNQSWASADLAAELAALDINGAVLARIGDYWSRRTQDMLIATMKGVFADNAASPSGADTHTQNDLTVDISGSAYSAGVTDFSASALIDAAQTMGDNSDALSLIVCHSAVLARMKKNDLIDFIPDSQNPLVRNMFFNGMYRIITDDSMPVSSGVYETWLFGAGAVRVGYGAPAIPFETERDPDAGNGGGRDIVYSRITRCYHPVGHAFIGSPGEGGPTNAATSNNLAAAASWRRVYPERKQIKIARLITREA